MNIRIAAVLMGIAAIALPASAAETPPARPKSGKVEIMPLSEVKQGMKGTAWTVFQGTEPEPIPVEIIGISKNMRSEEQTSELQSPFSNRGVFQIYHPPARGQAGHESHRVRGLPGHGPRADTGGDYRDFQEH